MGRSGEIQDGNPAFRALSGYDDEELSSVQYAELFDEGDRAEVLEEIRQLSAGTSAILERSRELRVNGGSTRSVKTQSILIRDGDGEPNHILVVLEGC